MKNVIKEYKNALSPKICEDIILLMNSCEYSSSSHILHKNIDK
jgi:hypothetical protein